MTLERYPAMKRPGPAQERQLLKHKPADAQAMGLALDGMSNAIKPNWAYLLKVLEGEAEKPKVAAYDCAAYREFDPNEHR